VRPVTRVQSGRAKAGVRFVGVVVALQQRPQQRAMTHSARALQLLLQAIRTVDSLAELERLHLAVRELYPGDDETMRQLTLEMEARAAALTARLEQGEMFPAAATDEVPDYGVGSVGPAPPELVREWCERVSTMGPDELSAFEALIAEHWERGSLVEVRRAIARRRGSLAG
jgi:hypothetical protein